MEWDLDEAAKDGKVDELKEILRNNPNIDVNWEGNLGSGHSPLTVACQGGRGAIVSILLAHPNIDANMKNKSGWTPFNYSCSMGKTILLYRELQH